MLDSSFLFGLRDLLLLDHVVPEVFFEFVSEFPVASWIFTVLGGVHMRVVTLEMALVGAEGGHSLVVVERL